MKLFRFGKQAKEVNQKEFKENRPQASPDEIISSYLDRIADERDIDEILIQTSEMGRDLICADRGTVWMLNRHTEELWTRIAHGLDRIIIPCTAGIAGYILTAGKPLIINDPYHDERFDKEVDKKTGYHTRNILGMPIHDAKGKLIGVFQAINKMPESKHFSEQDLEYARIAMNHFVEILEAVLLQESIDEAKQLLDDLDHDTR